MSQGTVFGVKRFVMGSAPDSLDWMDYPAKKEKNEQDKPLWVDLEWGKVWLQNFDTVIELSGISIPDSNPEAFLQRCPIPWW